MVYDVKRLGERLYPKYRSESDRLDEAVRFNLTANARILDLGCGSGRLFPFDYRGPTRRVVGIDLDPGILENGHVDDRVFGSGERLPFKAESFDLIYSRYVFEHLLHPERVFSEIARVLRSNGKLVLLTPNLFHYVPTFSRLTPAWFHKAFNERLRQRKSADTFPTVYRANTKGTLRKLATSAGLAELEVEMIETRPNYLMWSLPSFLVGVLYERLVNSTEFLNGLRVNILATYEKR